MISRESLDADVPRGAERTFCSRKAGWKAVLLREYKDPIAVEDYTTTPTCDQKIVLVTAGSCEIEAFRAGAWHGATYRPGHIGLVPPGTSARLRWHGTEHHHTVQLHVPGSLIRDVASELFDGTGGRVCALQGLSVIDPVVSTTLQSLSGAARSGAPDLHGETAAHFLVSHLLLRQTGRDAVPRGAPDVAAMHRVDLFLQGHLSDPVALADLATVAGCSRFQLLRMAKRAWGETPQRRLTRLRMEHARRLLASRRLSVIEVALECGYASPTHFATAFRRFSGVSPSSFLRRC